MSLANDVCVTSATGGTGDLVLSPITSGPFTHSPQFSDVWGTALPYPWVWYLIKEYTDATLLTELQWESGYCQLYSGTTLKRSGPNAQIRSTYVFGTGVKPSAVNGAPSPVNFGSTSANIRIFSAMTPDCAFQMPRFFNSSNSGTGSLLVTPGQADLMGRPTADTNVQTTPLDSATVTAGSAVIFTYLVSQYAPFSSFSILVTTAGSAGTKGRVGIYEDDGTGWLGQLIVDSAAVTGGTEFDTSSVGFKTSTMSTPIMLRPGMVWLYLTFSGAPTIMVMHNCLLNSLGTVKVETIRSASITGTYGPVPSTPPASSSANYNETTDNIIVVWLA